MDWKSREQSRLSMQNCAVKVHYQMNNLTNMDKETIIKKWESQTDEEEYMTLNDIINEEAISEAEGVEQE